jgi:hypothetical protein
MLEKLIKYDKWSPASSIDIIIGDLNFAEQLRKILRLMFAIWRTLEHRDINKGK